MAKDYLEQKEELEKVEVAVTVFEIEELHGRWKAFSSTVEEHKKNEIELSTTLQEKEGKLEELRNQSKNLDETISELQNVLLHTSEELEKLEGRKEVLKERKKNASQNKEQLQSNIDELTSKVANLTKQKQVIHDQAKILTKEAETIKLQLKEKQAQLSLLSENIEQKIEELKSEYIEILNEQAATKNELNLLEQQLHQQDARNTREEKNNEKYILERAEINKRKLVIEQTLSTIQNEIKTQVDLYRNEQLQVESLKKTYEKQEKTLYQAYQYLQQTKSRKEMLEEMEEGFAGFFQGVKEVLKARGE